MRSILWQRFIGLRRNSAPFLLMMFLPVLFTLFFGYAQTSGKIEVPIVDNDRSAWSKQVLAELNKSNLYRFEMTSQEEMEKLVSEGTAEAGFIIPDGFSTMMDDENKVTIEILKVKDSPTLMSLQESVRGTVQSVVDEKQAVLVLVDSMDRLGAPTTAAAVEDELDQKQAETTPYSFKTEAVGGEESFVYNQQLQSSLGFTLFFTMFTIIFSVAELVQEKERGILNRILVSPMTRVQMYAGNLVYSFLIGMIQVVLLVLIWKYVFHFDWGNSWLSLLTVLVAYVFATVAIGLLLTSFVKNLKQLNSIIPLIAVSSAMIGGAYWPIEVVQSNIMLFLAKLIPLSYTMEGVKALALYDEGFSAIWQGSLINLGIGGMLMVASLLLWEKRLS